MTNAMLRPALTKLLLTAALALPLAACLCPDSDGWSTTENDHYNQQQPPPQYTNGDPWNNWPPYGTAAASGADAGGLPSSDGGAAGAPGADAGGLPPSDGGAAGVSGSTMGAAGTTGTTGVGGSCGPDAGAPASVPVCQFDNQCGTNARCRNGACERGCTSSLTCGTGQTCAGGYCQAQPPTTTNGQCVYDAECGASSTCINGVCHARCQAGATCASPADRCVDGICQPDVGPRPQCHGATDCATGRACVNAVCRTACAGDVDCCAGTSGAFCRGGVCVTAHEAAPQCRLANQCGVGADCVDGICGG